MDTRKGSDNYMIHELIASHQLKSTLRRVKTLDGGVRVYEHADIKTRLVDPNDLAPTSKYVLKDNLAQVERIRNRVFNERGLDIFRFSGIVKMDDLVIAPPIVEEDLIVDGLHRNYIARANGEKIMVAQVRHALTGYEPIGVGLNWSQVVVRETQPTIGSECRVLRLGITDDPTILRRYYRDFSSLGSKGRRPRKGQNG